MSVSFEFERVSRTFSQNDIVRGTGVISTTESIKPKEIIFNAICVRTIDPKGHNLSGFDSAIPHNQENTIMQIPIKVNFPKVIEDGYKFDFEFKVESGNGLTESLRGKYISVDYLIEFIIKRGMLKSDIVATKEFFIVYDNNKREKGEEVQIEMNESNIKKGTTPTKFLAKIHLLTNVASFKKPPKGSIMFIESESPILSCTISYLRTEKITMDRTNPMTFVSEVCRMQILENDPPYNIEIPFNLEWVRILISPDIETKQFSFNIGLKIRVKFINGGYATAIIPLKLCRDLAY